jgi:DNA-binding protein Fis
MSSSKHFFSSVDPLDPDFDRAACRFFREYNGDPPEMSLNDFLVRFERAVVFHTLAEMNGCQRRAAKFLKLKDTTLNRKVKVQHIHFIKTPI